SLVAKLKAWHPAASLRPRAVAEADVACQQAGDPGRTGPPQPPRPLPWSEVAAGRGGTRALDHEAWGRAAGMSPFTEASASRCPMTGANLKRLLPAMTTTFFSAQDRNASLPAASFVVWHRRAE